MLQRVDMLGLRLRHVLERVLAMVCHLFTVIRCRLDQARDTISILRSTRAIKCA